MNDFGTFKAWSVPLEIQTPIKALLPEQINLDEVSLAIDSKELRLMNGISALERSCRLPSERNLSRISQLTKLDTKKILASVIDMGLAGIRIERPLPADQQNLPDGSLAYIRGWEFDQKITCYRLNSNGLGLFALKNVNTPKIT